MVYHKKHHKKHVKRTHRMGTYPHSNRNPKAVSRYVANPWLRPIESKHSTAVSLNQNLTNSGTATFWNKFGPSAGSTVETFTGTAVRVTGLRISGSVNNTATIADRWRMIVYCAEKVYATSAALTADLLDHTGSGLYVDDPLQVGFPGRVLADWHGGAQQQASDPSGAGSAMSMTLRKFLQLNIPIRYDPTGATIVSGEVGVIAIQTNATGGNVVFSGTVTFYFVDGFGFQSIGGSAGPSADMASGDVEGTEGMKRMCLYYISFRIEGGHVGFPRRGGDDFGNAPDWDGYADDTEDTYMALEDPVTPAFRGNVRTYSEYSAEKILPLTGPEYERQAWKNLRGGEF